MTKPEPSTPASSGAPVPLAVESAGRVQDLFSRRRQAHTQAAEYRRHGQLVPGSLNEEITDLSHELEYALKRYSQATQPRPLPRDPRSAG